MAEKNGPFDVDPDRAFDALLTTWGDCYDQFSQDDGLWSAHPIGAPGDMLVTGNTPDELNAALRADWSRRQSGPGIPPQQGPSGMPPS